MLVNFLNQLFFHILYLSDNQYIKNHLLPFLTNRFNNSIRLSLHIRLDYVIHLIRFLNTQKNRCLWIFQFTKGFHCTMKAFSFHPIFMYLYIIRFTNKNFAYMLFLFHYSSVKKSNRSYGSMSLS